MGKGILFIAHILVLQRSHFPPKHLKPVTPVAPHEMPKLQHTVLTQTTPRAP